MLTHFYNLKVVNQIGYNQKVLAAILIMLLHIFPVFCQSSFYTSDPYRLIPYRKGSLWAYADKCKNFKTDFIYQEAYLHSGNGLARVKYKGKYGLINKQCAWIVAALYDTIGVFAHNRAVVKKQGKYGYINQMGKLVIPFIYDEASDFEMDYYFNQKTIAAVVFNGKEYSVDENGKRGMFFLPPEVGKDEEIATETSTNENNNDLLVFKENGFYGLKRAKGLLLLKPQYDSIIGPPKTFCAFLVRYKGQWGAVTTEAKRLISTNYDLVQESACNEFIISKNNLYGFVSLFGSLATEFDSIEYTGVEDFLWVKYKGKYGYASKQGYIFYED
jgi:WG containing repeat